MARRKRGLDISVQNSRTSGERSANPPPSTIARPRTSSGRRIAMRAAEKPPTELPTTIAPSGASDARTSSATDARHIALAVAVPAGDSPCAGQSSAIVVSSPSCERSSSQSWRSCAPLGSRRRGGGPPAARRRAAQVVGDGPVEVSIRSVMARTLSQ